MKSRTLFAAVFFLLISFLSILYSQDKTPSIVVTGNATIKVVPDIMRWSVNIRVDMDDVGSAKTEHNRALNKVMDILKQNGVPDNEIQTSGVRVNKNLYLTNKHDKKFTVSSDIWFSIFEISKYGNISEALMDEDNVYITNTTLEYSKAIETRMTARTDALNAAKKKAGEMADVLGQSIGRPLLIEEESFSYFPANLNNIVSYDNNQGNENSGALFSEGTVNITARVKVTFELLNK